MNVRGLWGGNEFKKNKLPESFISGIKKHQFEKKKGGGIKKQKSEQNSTIHGVVVMLAHL